MRKTITTALIFLGLSLTAIAAPGIEFTRILIGHTSSVSSAAFTPDSKYLLTAGFDGNVIIWQAYGQWKKKGEINAGVPVESMAISPGGKLLATGCRDKSLKIWELPSGKLLKHIAGFADTVYSCAFSTDNAAFAAGAKGTVDVFSTATFEKITGLGTEGNIARAIEFTPDGKRLIFAAGRHVTVRDIREKGLLKKLFKKEGPDFGEPRSLNSGLLVYSAAVSPDSQYAAAAGEEGMLRLFRLEDGILMWVLRAHEGRIWDISFSADGKKIATAGSDTDVRITDAVSGEVFTTIAGCEDEVFSVAFSPDGKYIAAASKDGKVKVWTTPFVKKKMIAGGYLLVLAAVVIFTVLLIYLRKKFKG